MGKARDWKKDGESVGVNLIEKDGDTLICEKDGFIFKIHRSNWPPAKLSPVQCFTSTDYFKYQVKQLHGETYDLSKNETSCKATVPKGTLVFNVTQVYADNTESLFSNSLTYTE